LLSAVSTRKFLLFIFLLKMENNERPRKTIGNPSSRGDSEWINTNKI
jgi:hypothetical protein